MGPTVKARSVVIIWKPTRPGVVLRELEVWARGTAGVESPAQLPDALYSGVPAGAIEARAPQGEQTIAPSRGPGVFTVALNREPNAFDRAFIVYELAGLPHFTAAVRSINGHHAAG